MTWNYGLHQNSYPTSILQAINSLFHFFIKKKIHPNPFMHMSGCPRVCLCTAWILCSWKPEKDTGSHRTWVTNGCELPVFRVRVKKKPCWAISLATISPFPLYFVMLIRFKEKPTYWEALTGNLNFLQAPVLQNSYSGLSSGSVGNAPARQFGSPATTEKVGPSDVGLNVHSP